MRLFIFLCFVVFLFTCAQPRFDVIFVSADGSDDNSGTKKAPLATISAAVEKAKNYLDSGGGSDMVIQVMKGSYNIDIPVELDRLTVNSDSQNIIIRGEIDQLPLLCSHSGLPIFLINGKTDSAITKNIIVEQLSFAGAKGVNHLDDTLKVQNNTADPSGFGFFYINNAENITIQNCRFENSAGDGIVVQGFARNITVAHNEVKNCFSSGIAFIGATTGSDGTTGAVNNSIIFNDISYIKPGNVTSGAILLTGSGRKNRIEYNLIQNIRSPGTEMYAGIYVDGQLTHTFIQNNLVCGMSGSNVVPLFAGGSGTVINNNIFANNKCGKGFVVYFAGIDSASTSQIFTHNIVYNNFCDALFSVADWNPARIALSDSNLFFHYSPRFRVLGIPYGELLQDWVGDAGYDQNSRIIDPRFVNPDVKDFSFKRDSPAPAMGFIPVNRDSIGLQ
ncbi:right-handed parallel beta-helix repeat-containing protein [candidate division KSB1 bacterium]|nr:right-handed parallel beta-helix repeat-containing protein [candidate division KSB1 bacterium]